MLNTKGEEFRMFSILAPKWAHASSECGLPNLYFATTNQPASLFLRILFGFRSLLRDSQSDCKKKGQNLGFFYLKCVFFNQKCIPRCVFICVILRERLLTESLAIPTST